jgi:hypothetical protein
MRKRLLRKGGVGTNPQNLNIQLLKRAIVGLPGRHVLGSVRPEIVNMKLEQNQLLPLELAQADLLPRRAGEREVRRLLPDVKCLGHADYRQCTGQQRTQ